MFLKLFRTGNLMKCLEKKNTRSLRIDGRSREVQSLGRNGSRNTIAV